MSETVTNLYNSLEAAPDVAPGQITALLDQGCSFDGRLTFEGTVRIGGAFRGEIFTNDTLVINPGAKVDAQIEADTVIICGAVNTVLGSQTLWCCQNRKRERNSKADKCY